MEKSGEPAELDAAMAAQEKEDEAKRAVEHAGGARRGRCGRS